MFAAIDQWIRSSLEVAVGVGHHVILPMMVFGFFVAVALRLLMSHTVNRQAWFVNEFHKRALRMQESLNGARIPSFYMFVKKHIEQTFYELFAVRGIQMRRNLDFVMHPSDRVFLVQPGCARVVKDLERNLKSLKTDKQTPNFSLVARSVLEENPCFSKILGVIPMGPVNEFMGLLPGFFILGGIFGTFLSIMRALPELGQMNLTDVDGTKEAMAAFILKVSISMATSVVGIVLSVLFSAFSSVWSAERTFASTVDRLSTTLEFLWSASASNDSDRQSDFDPNRDPLEALAEAAVQNEIDKLSKTDGANHRDAVPPPPPSNKAA